MAIPESLASGTYTPTVAAGSLTNGTPTILILEEPDANTPSNALVAALSRAANEAKFVGSRSEVNATFTWLAVLFEATATVNCTRTPLRSRRRMFEMVSVTELLATLPATASVKTRPAFIVFVKSALLARDENSMAPSTVHAIGSAVVISLVAVAPVPGPAPVVGDFSADVDAGDGATVTTTLEPLGVVDVDAPLPPCCPEDGEGAAAAGVGVVVGVRSIGGGAAHHAATSSGHLTVPPALNVSPGIVLAAPASPASQCTSRLTPSLSLARMISRCVLPSSVVVHSVS